MRVAIVGATGIAGQQFLAALQGHPYIRIEKLAASPRTAGNRYVAAISGDGDGAIGGGSCAAKNQCTPARSNHGGNRLALRTPVSASTRTAAENRVCDTGGHRTGAGAGRHGQSGEFAKSRTTRVVTARRNAIRVQRYKSLMHELLMWSISAAVFKIVSRQQRRTYSTVRLAY